MGDTISTCEIINAVVFGITFIEIVFQLIISLFNRQKLRRLHFISYLTLSDYFKFLFYSFWWTLLRALLSIPAITQNTSLVNGMLDLIYPAIVSSFLLILQHYSKVDSCGTLK